MATFDSTAQIHAFLTFDGRIPAASVPAAFAKYDFVWGTSPQYVDPGHTVSPSTVTSSYVPFDIDPSGARDLAWWQANHPDWVLYRCDGATPAYRETLPGNIPLDISNPAVRAWQLANYIQPAADQGFDSIAFDMVDLINGQGACGVYRNGQWAQLYTADPDNDPTYSKDVVDWMAAMHSAMHGMSPPMALIPNFALTTSPDDPLNARILANVDAILDERGFTDWGSGYAPADEWLMDVQWMRRVQAAGKPFYTLSQFNQVTAANLQWALASYLMGKDEAAAIYVSGSQDYGLDQWHNEFNTNLGVACGDMQKYGAVYVRSFENGLSLVNPGDVSGTYVLPVGVGLTRLNGVAVGAQVTLAAHSGLVLVGGGSGLCALGI